MSGIIISIREVGIWDHQKKNELPSIYHFDVIDGKIEAIQWIQSLARLNVGQAWADVVQRHKMILLQKRRETEA